MTSATGTRHLFPNGDHVRVPREILGLVGPAYAVWRAMLEARDDDGVCRATFDELAKAAGLSSGQVSHAVERHLAPVGLVVTLGQDVAPSRRSHRFERLVVGHDEQGGTVRVPRSVNERAIANFEAAARPSPRPSLLAARAPHLCLAPVGVGIRCAGSVIGGCRPTETPPRAPAACDNGGFSSATGRRPPVIAGPSELAETGPLFMTANGCHLDHACVVEGEDQKPEPKRGQPGAPSAPGADPDVRCVAALQVDGATSIIAKAGEAGWHPDVQDELRAAHRGATVRLPDPSGPGPIALAVKRNHGPHLHLHVAGRVTIKIDRRHETVEVIAAKEELWTGGGFGAWADTWLRLASYWFLDQPSGGLANAAALGWRVHNLEVASDFVGLSIDLVDTANFKSPSTITVINPAKCETVQVGSRGRGAISMSVHDKHEQIRKVHNVKPSNSIYAPHWSGNGWNGVRCIRRVELRADGHALKFKDTGTGQVFDLTNPAALLDRNALAHLWHEGTRRHRLAVPAQGIGKGKKAPTDPRWIAVQSLANVSGVGRSVHLRPAPTPRQPRVAAEAADALAQALDGIRAAGIVSEDVCAQLVQLVADEGGDDAFVDKLDAALSSLGLPTTGSYAAPPPPAPRIGD